MWTVFYASVNWNNILEQIYALHSYSCAEISIKISCAEIHIDTFCKLLYILYNIFMDIEYFCKKLRLN